MTAVVAWKRAFKQGPEELCLASDSRLGGDGRRIDCAPKLFSLQRGDIALAFTGDTGVAYPFIMQVINASNSFRASRTRGLDLIEYRSHIIKILNQISDSIVTSMPDLKLPDVSFILGGYSWIEKEFHLWLINYKKNLKRFHYDTAFSLGGRRECILFAGDKGKDLKAVFLKLMHEKHGKQFKKLRLDFEPFEALVRMLRLNNDDLKSTIGGPPQLMKIYQHINTSAIPIYWPTMHSNSITLLGRKMLATERIDEWVLDPDTMKRYPQGKEQ